MNIFYCQYIHCKANRLYCRHILFIIMLHINVLISHFIRLPYENVNKLLCCLPSSSLKQLYTCNIVFPFLQQYISSNSASLHALINAYRQYLVALSYEMCYLPSSPIVSRTLATCFIPQSISDINGHT